MFLSKSKLLNKLFTKQPKFFFGGNPNPSQTINLEQGATSNFVESITSAVKGLTHSNYVVEHDPSLTAE